MASQQDNAQGKTVKVIVAGGRDYADYEVMSRTLDAVFAAWPEEIIIVSGRAKGADTLGERYAAEHGLATSLHPADWKRHGRKAGYRRNEEMGKLADRLVAFWDGQSKGTKHMIDHMRSLGKDALVFGYDGRELAE